MPNGTMKMPKTTHMVISGSTSQPIIRVAAVAISRVPQKPMQMVPKINATLTPMANTMLARLSARSIASVVLSVRASSMARWIGPICNRSSRMPFG